VLLQDLPPIQKPSQKFQYLVRYETFFSTSLGKEKGFFVILPEDFSKNPSAKYSVLFQNKMGTVVLAH